MTIEQLFVVFLVALLVGLSVGFFVSVRRSK
jgi:uncharacterized protein YneF (UPF0154 family)